MLNGEGDVEEVVSITGWNTDSVADYLKEKLPTS